MKRFYSTLAFILFTAIFAFSVKRAEACHAIALVNITQQTPIAGGIIVNAASDSPTCGCAAYWLDVEVRCIGEAFNGAPFSPGFYGPLGTYPFYQSAQMMKPSCVVQNYPGVTISFASLCPGTTYQYRMRENHNFSVGPWCATQTFVVPGIMPTFTATVAATANNICAGACTTITATPTGGCQIAVLYNWSTGATTPSITVCPGVTTTYTCAVTDDCSNQVANVSMTINVVPAPIAGTASVTPASVCSGTPVNLTLTGSTGGIQWQSAPTAGGPFTNIAGATTATFITAGMTANTCFRAEVSGCGAPVYSNVICITINPAPTVTVNSPTICPGATANLTASGATSYVWTAGATTTGINTADASPLATTTYTVTGTTAGCTGTAIATVTVNPGTPITVNSPTICEGDVATLTGAGATSYSWSTGAITNPITVTPTTTTSYTVTGTTGGCTSTAISTVTVNPLPITTVNSPNVCPTFTANLIAGGATTYTWSAGATATGVNTADASPAVTTTYTVTGTTLGCSSTAVATVTVNSGLVINAGLNDTICFGGSTILGVTPAGAGFTYDWTPAATLVGATTATPTASPAATTTYSVLVTDASGCTGTSTVTVFADPEITLAIAGIDVTCNGACNGQTIVIPAGGTPAYTYAWSSGCTAASCSPLCIGTYTVTVTDSWGCTSSGTATIIEPTLLTASISGTTPTSCNAVCDGTATATGAGGTIGAGYSYSWNTVPVQTTATATGLCAGTYTCTITDANSCTATVTATITEPTLVVIAPIAPAAVCTGGSTMITASASGGNGGAYSYTWSPAAGLDFTNISNPTSTPAATTVYTVNATDVNGCPSAPATVTVTVNPPLTVVASGTASICPGASTSISALASLGTGGPYTYSWAPAGAGTPLTVSPAVTTTYTVTASDGCSPTVTATVTVTVLPLPVVAFSAPITSGCEPLCVTFTDNSTVAGGAIATWNWDFGDGNTSTLPTPTNCYAAAGSYNVTLSVTSTLGGCSSTSTVLGYITVHPNPIADFTAPLSSSILNPDVSYVDNSSVATGAITGWQWNFGDPFAGTDSTSSLQNPTHTFTEAGTYCASLIVTTNFGCTNNTQLCIIIDPEFTFFIPNAFSPNGDGINDEFYGKGDYIKKYELLIYDRWGNLIFFADDIHKHWDGIANHGKEIAQEDVYVYVVKITDHKDKKHKYTGTVTIVK